MVMEQIKLHTSQKDEKGEWQTDNQAGNLIAHAIPGELAAKVIRDKLYNKDVKDLTEAEKQNISALTQLVIGLTIASMGGDTGDVATGIDSSKNAVENNNLYWVLRGVFGGKPITVSMYEYIVMQGFTASQAELLINSMTDAEKELFKLRMGLGAEYALGQQINELVDKSANMDALEPDKLPQIEGYPIPEEKKTIIISTPIPEQDKDAGKLVTPIVEKDKNEGIYAGPEIDIGD